MDAKTEKILQALETVHETLVLALKRFDMIEERLAKLEEWARRH